MFRLLPALVALFLAGAASAQNPAPTRFVPAIVFDIGGKHDKGFNEAGLQGPSATAAPPAPPIASTS